jgi:hypothetical protein
MAAFVDELRAVNARAKVILTVSPVPLVATAEDSHVLVATTYSKSVLRVAAEAIVRRRSSVAYFPSFEIVTGPQAQGRYFDADLRSVTEAGVDRVMDLFSLHVLSTSLDCRGVGSSVPLEDEEFHQMARAVMDVMCDEESLDPRP